MIPSATPPEGPRRKGGRPATHSATALRKAVTRLGTRRLDGRSAVAVAARRFVADLTADVGGDPSRAQRTLIELAARTWIVVEALDDWIMRQPSLVLHRKRSVVPVLLQRQQLVDSLARTLERLGLERRARDVADLATYLATKRKQDAESETPPATDAPCATTGSTTSATMAQESTQEPRE